MYPLNTDRAPRWLFLWGLKLKEKMYDLILILAVLLEERQTNDKIKKEVWPLEFTVKMAENKVYAINVAYKYINFRPYLLKE